MPYYVIESDDGRMDIPAAYDSESDAMDHVYWLENRYPSYKGRFRVFEINDPTEFLEK